MGTFFRAVIYSALLAKVFFVVSITACGGASQDPPLPHSEAVSAELSWQTDADLDLEIWRDSGGVPVMLGESYNLSRKSPDQVDGRDDRFERFLFEPPFDTGVYLLVVGFWAEGPEKQPIADATLTIRGRNNHLVQYTGRLDDNSSDLWFVCRIDAASGVSESVDSYTYRGM